MNITNVFIDTCIFYENQFIFSGPIKTIIKAVEENKIKIILPEITEKEVLCNIQHFQMDELKKLKKQLDSFVLRKIPEFEEVINSLKCLICDKDNFIEEVFMKSIVSQPNTVHLKIQKNIDLQSIVNNYFEKNPPFSDKKKSEFPDAIVLKSLELWCEENNQKCIILSKDNDFIRYKSDCLIHKDMDEFIKEIVADETEIGLLRIELMKRLGVSNVDEKIVDQISDYYDNESLYCNLLNIDDIYDYIINNISLEYRDNCTLIGHYDGLYIFRFIVSVTAKVSVNYPDYDTGIYDNEDHRWYFREDVESMFTSVLEFPVDISIDKQSLELKIESINCNRTFSDKVICRSFNVENEIA